MTLNLKFDLDPTLFRENECHHRIPRGRFSLKKYVCCCYLLFPFSPLLRRLKDATFLHIFLFIRLSHQHLNAEICVMK